MRFGGARGVPGHGQPAEGPPDSRGKQNGAAGEPAALTAPWSTYCAEVGPGRPSRVRITRPPGGGNGRPRRHGQNTTPGAPCRQNLARTPRVKAQRAICGQRAREVSAVNSDGTRVCKTGYPGFSGARHGVSGVACPTGLTIPVRPDRAGCVAGAPLLFREPRYTRPSIEPFRVGGSLLKPKGGVESCKQWPIGPEARSFWARSSSVGS